LRLYFFTAVLVALMSGCSVSTSPITEYRIGSNQKIVIDNSDSKCSEKSLKVAEAFSPNSLMSMDMNYVIDENKQFRYSQSQWSSSPNSAITAEIVKLMRDIKLFKTVQISKSRTKNDMVLEVSIDKFIQYFTQENKKSFVNVSITLTLIDSKTSVAIATKTFDVKLDSKSLDAEGGVEALNMALNKIFTQSAKWIGGVCR